MNERMVECVKLGKLGPGLKRRPVPGELGERIFQTISQEAWQLWLKRQTMFINENRLEVTDPQAQLFLQDKMEAFLFHNEDEKPAGYTA